MNQHSLTRKKYYLPLIGAALAVASLFQFSLPVFAAGTQAGQTLSNTATGTYKDDAGNEYTIESNTVDVTVAKVAGITNMPTGFDDLTSSATNTKVLTGDEVAFEFTITNVGNDISNIFIPALADIATKGLNTSSLKIQVSPAQAPGAPAYTFPATGDARPTNGIVKDVPINGTVVVRVTGKVSATAAGAPIQVKLGDTPPNTDINNPLPGTQNQPDAPGAADTTDAQNKDVRTETSANSGVAGAPADGQKEASAVQQVFLGANPMAMTRIEKTRGAIEPGTPATDLSKTIVPYSLDLEVLNTTPNPLYTPGDLEGRDYSATTFTGIGDKTNLILVSDAIPANTKLSATIAPVGKWIPVYTTDSSGTPDTMKWTTTPPATQADRDAVTRVGWVYDAKANGAIAAGSTVTAAQGGFTFKVVTSGLNATTGGTVANIAQVFGGTVNGADIFDESGDQDPSNFNGANPGPKETDPQSTGIANPATHATDSTNDNNIAGTLPASPGGEDNVLTIGAPGKLVNGPDQKPNATGDVFGIASADNDHDFQNLGVENFPDNAKPGTTFDPAPVTFKNTLSNPGTTDLKDVLLQPINPEFDPAFNGTSKDTDLPVGTKVTLTLGTQVATYTYIADPDNPGKFKFDLTDGAPIIIPTLAAGVPLDYTSTVDLPAGTGLSTDDAINGGFPVPIIAFVDGNNDGTPQATENRNITVDQIYTGLVKVIKQVRVIDGVTGDTKPGMDFDDPNASKQPAPGDKLEYRVIYRNISEPQAGNGTNGILNGVNVMIDEDGTLDKIDNGALDASDNNWALDKNNDSDLDTINVQNSAKDSNNGTITFFTGNATTVTPLSSVSAGTTDPGDTVTGYRSMVELLAPTGAEPAAKLNTYDPAAGGDSSFTFQRKVDQFDGMGAEGLDP